jgi:hypothetical protein
MYFGNRNQNVCTCTTIATSSWYTYTLYVQYKLYLTSLLQQFSIENTNVMGCFGTRFVVIPGKTRISFDGGKLTPGDLNSLVCVTLRVLLLDGVNIKVWIIATRN